MTPRTVAIAVLSSAWLLASPASGQAETVIKVSVTDSLAQALAKARNVRASAARGTVVIELQAGTHRLREPLQLGPEDSGSAERPLVIRGASGGKAVLSGGEPLQRLDADPALLARYPETARGSLAIYALPEPARSATTVHVLRRYDRNSGAAPLEVFDAKGPLRPARWPNEGWAQGTAKSSPAATELSAGAWKGAASLDGDVWLAGFPQHDWAYEVVRISGRDAASTALRLANPPVFGFAPTFRLAILHNRADLDEPGEWHRDQASGRLVVWPRAGGGMIEASLAPSLLVMTGARHVRIEGLTLENVRGDAIFVQGGSHIAIDRVTIRHTGGRAVAFEGPTDSVVRRSHIHDTGDGGIILSGGDRITLTAANLRVEDTIIERFARLGLSNRPAVSMHGVGNSVRASYIADGPHIAIDFTGNLHTIAGNEIARVVRETGDAGAIYTGRDWTAQGTIITGNFLHDIRAGQGREVKGVYLDDLASGVTVEGNVFLRVDQPVFIGGGRDNVVRGNLFVASSPAIHIDGRGVTWMTEAVRNPEGELRTRLRAMPTAQPAWQRRFPELSRTLSDEPARPKRNSALGNQILAGAGYRLLPEVDARAQRLEPEDAARRVERSIGATLVRRAEDADTAAALGALLRASSGLQLPFEQMDRRGALKR